MAQRLHLVFGGELIDPAHPKFKNVKDVEVVGMFADYDAAYDAWKDASQKSVDNANSRFFIAHLHRLRDETEPAGPTAELG